VAIRFDAELIAVHVMPDKPVSQAERRVAEAEFQAERARSPEPSMGGARGDASLQGQPPAEQPGEPEGRFRRAVPTAPV